MIEGIPPGLMDLSGWGVVGLIVVLLLLGKGGIAFRREVDAEKVRADTWQAAWQAERAASQEKDATSVELLENSRTTVRVLEVLQAQAERGESP